MGEQADLILNGDVCEGCGENFDDEGSGFPRRCSACGGGESHAERRSMKEGRRNEARRLFKAAGFNWESFNNDYHWRVGGLDFFPTTERWQDTKNDFKGHGTEAFIKYVRTRQHKPQGNIKILTVEQIFDAVRKSKKTNLFEICEVVHKEIYQ